MFLLKREPYSAYHLMAYLDKKAFLLKRETPICSTIVYEYIIYIRLMIRLFALSTPDESKDAR